MSKSNKKILALIVALWAALGGVYAANAQPATRPAPRPATTVMAPPSAMTVAAPAAMTTAMAAPVAAMPAVAAPAPVAATPAPAMAAAEPVMAAATTPATPATPAAAKQDSKGSVVGGWALQIVLYLLGIFLTAFIPVFTAWLYKKFKLTNLEQKDKIDQMVEKAVMFGIGKAEEAAYKMRDNPMDSAKKLDTAVATANKYLRDSGLPEKGAEYLADLIESKLGVTRDNAATKPAEAPATEDKPADEAPKEGDK